MLPVAAGVLLMLAINLAAVEQNAEVIVNQDHDT
jgi:hypothetical protein